MEKTQKSLLTSKDKRLTTIHTQQSVTQVFLWQPTDSYQLEVIHKRKLHVLLCLESIFFHRIF